jgi:hypothetical protein
VTLDGQVVLGGEPIGPSTSLKPHTLAANFDHCLVADDTLLGNQFAVTLSGSASAKFNYAFTGTSLNLDSITTLNQLSFDSAQLQGNGKFHAALTTDVSGATLNTDAISYTVEPTAGATLTNLASKRTLTFTGGRFAVQGEKLVMTQLSFTLEGVAYVLDGSSTTTMTLTGNGKSIATMSTPASGLPTFSFPGIVPVF